MEVITRTERLTLRRFELADAEAMHALNGDPEVTRYVGDPPFESLDAAGDFVTGYLRDVALPEGDLSRWAVVENATGDVLGFCGLRRQADATVDLGYRLLRRAWGRGYATEAARATLESEPCPSRDFGTAGMHRRPRSCALSRNPKAATPLAAFVYLFPDHPRTAPIPERRPHQEPPMTRTEYDFDVCCGPAAAPPGVSAPPRPAPAKAGTAASLDPAPAPADRIDPP